MTEAIPTALDRLWGAAAGPGRPARVGLSLERIVEGAVELADQDGIGAVSMKRVAEGLGFTTMALYRHMAGKDELLLMMQDACWRPPEGFDIPPDDWRAGLESWTRGQVAILDRHPWLEQVRHIERAGTPSQLMWMELGLRALSRTPLAEGHKIELLLLLSGYTFTVRAALGHSGRRRAARLLPGRRRGSRLRRPPAAGRPARRGSRRCWGRWPAGRSRRTGPSRISSSTCASCSTAWTRSSRVRRALPAETLREEPTGYFPARA